MTREPAGGRRAFLRTLAAVAVAVPSARPAGAWQTGATAPVRRGYVDAGDGQVHLRHTTVDRTARTPIVCLHDTPGSGRAFTGLLEALDDRFALAPDLPGYGESYVPASPPGIDGYAWAVGTALDRLGLEQVDVLGIGVGALVGVELAVTRGRLVRRLVLASIPLLDADGRRAAAAASAPPAADADGRHVLDAWRSAVERRGPGERLDALTEEAADALAAGPRAWWGTLAASGYRLDEKLPFLDLPVLVLKLADDRAAHTAAAAARLGHARLVETTDLGRGAFRAAPGRMAALIRAFCDEAAPP